MLGLLTVVTLFLGALGQSEVELISLNGYPVETHNVTTEDKYILQLVRIPHGKNSTNNSNGVVFLMHGIISNFVSFTYLGPEYAIAYNLADAGYDVWMGNARGNMYSRRHVYLDPDVDKLQYFDFSFEEIGLFDLPAMIDYVLDVTKKPKLHYVAHSQGGTVFLVLNSMKTAYQSKFASANLLTGIGYSTDFPNKVVLTFCGMNDVVYSLAVTLGFVEVKATSVVKALGRILVNAEAPSRISDAAAIKQGAHFCQVFRDKKFRRYNYGLQNLLKYGRLAPPLYDLTKIHVNTTFHYSLGDITQSETDALLMARDMPNARARKVPSNDFNHLGYLIREDVKELVTNSVIESIRNS